MDFVLDLLQGVGLAAAIGVRPWLPMLLAGLLAAANLGIDFDGTDFAFLESIPVLAVFAVRVLRLRAARAALRGARTDLGLRRPRGDPGRRGGRRLARGPRALDHPGRGPRRRCRGARLPRRAKPVHPRAPPPGRGGGRGPPGLRRGPGAGRRRPLDPLPAAGAAGDRRARLAAALQAVAARARSTPACAYCGEEARPRGHRRDEARDARAGGRERPRAGARAVDRTRRARRRLRRSVPVRDPRVRRVDRDGDDARPARDPVDELVPPRRGALRRVRHQLQGLAGVRLQAVADGHDLQHEPRAPVVGDADGVRATRRRRTCGRPARRISCTAAVIATRSPTRPR